MLIKLPYCMSDHIFEVLPTVCRNGNVRLATLLLRKSCELDESLCCPSDKMLKASLRVAAKKGNAPLVDAILPFLLPRYSDSETTFDPAKLKQSLHIAIKKGYWGIAEKLIAAGKISTH